MHALINSLSFPWYFYVIAGIFVVLLIGHKGVRNEFDAFLAYCFGLKEKETKRRVRSKENEE